MAKDRHGPPGVTVDGMTARRDQCAAFIRASKNLGAAKIAGELAGFHAPPKTWLQAYVQVLAEERERIRWE